MYRTEVLNKRKGFDNLNAIVDGYLDHQLDVAERVIREGDKELLADFRQTPGKHKRPTDWQTPKQMRAFFATNGFGGGIPSQRTGAIAKGINTHITRTKDSLTYAVESRSKHAKFVVGFLNPDLNSPIQRMHMRTGWQPLSIKLIRWRKVVGGNVIRALMDGRR